MKTDWQQDDEIVILQDDLYSIAWDSNFGEALFDKPTQPTSNDTGTTITIIPQEVPHSEAPMPNPESSKDTPGSIIQTDHPPSPNSQKSGGTPETTVSGPKVPDTQQEEVPGPSGTENENTETLRGNKYNLRPNPNPNYSNSYRY